jgi:hypothetical protein
MPTDVIIATKREPRRRAIADGCGLPFTLAHCRLTHSVANEDGLARLYYSQQAVLAKKQNSFNRCESG